MRLQRRPDTAIIHYNSDGWPALLTESQMAIMERAKLTIGPWVWEMGEVPTKLEISKNVVTGRAIEKMLSASQANIRWEAGL